MATQSSALQYVHKCVETPIVPDDMGSEGPLEESAPKEAMERPCLSVQIPADDGGAHDLRVCFRDSGEAQSQLLKYSW